MALFDTKRGIMTKKTGNKVKRINKTPSELLQSEYEKSQVRMSADSVPMDILLEQCGISSGDVVPVKTPLPAPVKHVAPAPVFRVPPLLLNVSEVCALLGVSRSTFFRMKKADEIPGCVSVGGQVRYRREDLERWVKQLPEFR
jgi:excisionase family DNA binding protein